MPKSIDLTGQVFGHLTVIGIGEPYITKEGWKRKRWHCQCDCGKTSEVSTSSLRSGGTTSCGHAAHPENKSKHSELVGRKFGHITVIEDVGTRLRHQVKWLCKCDCGKQLHITSGHLLSGNTTSCGHVGAERIKKYMLEQKTIQGGTRVELLNDKSSKNNKLGIRNISITSKKGVDRYRVAVVYKRKQYGGIYDSLEEAIKVRDEIRKKYWPNYKGK